MRGAGELVADAAQQKFGRQAVTLESDNAAAVEGKKSVWK